MEIVDQVNRKEDGLVSDDEESDSNGEEKHMGYSTAIKICHQLEGYCLDVGGEHPLGLLRSLRRF